jgi:hypothetical protein
MWPRGKSPNRAACFTKTMLSSGQLLPLPPSAFLSRPCAVPDCKRRVVGFLLAVPYCPRHFIAACNFKMNVLAKNLTANCTTAAGQKQMRKELGQMADQVFASSLWPELFDGYERIRLLEILERLGLLLSKVRRGERIPATISIRLQGDQPVKTWAEDTETATLSWHGAMLRSSRCFRRGDFLTIKRLDVGSTARARVVWQDKNARQGAMTAIEILNKLNFWS